MILSTPQKLHAHDFIQEMPRSYDTELGERGGKLSTGKGKDFLLQEHY